MRLPPKCCNVHRDQDEIKTQMLKHAQYGILQIETEITENGAALISHVCGRNPS